jgi:hypothetical protein
VDPVAGAGEPDRAGVLTEVCGVGRESVRQRRVVQSPENRCRRGDVGLRRLRSFADGGTVRREQALGTGPGPGLPVVVQFGVVEGTLAAAAREDGRHQSPVRPRQQSLGHLWHLKQSHVRRAKRLQWVTEHAPLHRDRMGGVHRDDAVNALGELGGDPPGDGAAPVVTDDGNRLLAGVVHDGQGVSREVVEAVQREAVGSVGLVHTATVGDVHLVTRLDEGGNLVSPAEPEVWKAV